MIKLAAITQFLIELDLVAAEQVDSWAENVRFNSMCKNLNTGLVLYRMEYDAVISIERFNHKRHQPELLFAQVVAWLLNNDDNREELDLTSPDTDVDILDNTTADIEITIPFVEDVGVVPDENGEIVVDGEKYRLDIVPIDYAESGEVKTDGD